MKIKVTYITNGNLLKSRIDINYYEGEALEYANKTCNINKLKTEIQTKRTNNKVNIMFKKK